MGRVARGSLVAARLRGSRARERHVHDRGARPLARQGGPPSHAPRLRRTRRRGDRVRSIEPARVTRPSRRGPKRSTARRRFSGGSHAEPTIVSSRQPSVSRSPTGPSPWTWSHCHRAESGAKRVIRASRDAGNAAIDAHVVSGTQRSPRLPVTLSMESEQPEIAAPIANAEASDHRVQRSHRDTLRSEGVVVRASASMSCRTKGLPSRVTRDNSDA